MNESSTFYSRYLSGIETRFRRDDWNDDSIEEDEVIGEFKVFVQNVRPLGASRLRSISQEKKQFFYWYILNNVDEIEKYQKYAFLYLDQFTHPFDNIYFKSLHFVGTQTHNCVL